MHYGSTAFGKVDLFGNRATTLETTGAIGQRAGLSAKDIAAIDALYPPGAVVDLYEGNGATQDVVCSLVVGDEGFFSYTFPDLDECDNDEARSIVLHDIPAGRVIRLYDSPSGSTDDDWVRIRVLQPVTEYVIPTFEQSFEDASVHVTYYPDNGLDGKVSRLVTSGNASPSVTIVQPTGESPFPTAASTSSTSRRRRTIPKTVSAAAPSCGPRTSMACSEPALRSSTPSSSPAPGS